MNIFSDFTSFSLLPPSPDEVAGGLSGSRVKMNAEKMCDSAVQQGAAEWKGNCSPYTLWHQVPVPSEMRIGHLWMELFSPPSGRRGCIFFSAELISSREESFFSKFVKKVASERGEALDYVGLSSLPGLLTDFLCDFPPRFLFLLMHLSILVIRVWLKQHPGSTS